MPYLPEEIPNARVLLAVKAYPSPSKKYGELVCTAGMIEISGSSIHQERTIPTSTFLGRPNVAQHQRGSTTHARPSTLRTCETEWETYRTCGRSALAPRPLSCHGELVMDA